MVITFAEGDPFVAYFAPPADDEITWDMGIRWVDEEALSDRVPWYGEPEEGETPIKIWHVFHSEYSKATKVLTITRIDLDEDENNSTTVYDDDEITNQDAKIPLQYCDVFPGEYDYTYYIVEDYYSSIGDFRRFDFTDYRNTPNVSLTKTSNMNTKIIVHFDQGPDLIYYFKDNRS